MFIFVDTETTGFARGGIQPRIVSISWLIANNPYENLSFQHRIIMPTDFDIPDDAARVHGITTEYAMEYGSPIELVLNQLSAEISAYAPETIVAHNISFDIPVIEAEYTRAMWPSPCENLSKFCTLDAARRRWPKQSARLSDVFQRVFQSQMDNAHDASADVLACSKVFFHFSGYDSIPVFSHDNESATVIREGNLKKIDAVLGSGLTT